MCSKYDRQTDKRNFSERRDMFMKQLQGKTDSAGSAAEEAEE